MPSINVKWQKEKYTIDVDTTQPPLVFKAQLYALTQVVPERQKVLITGKQLPDDSWDGFTIKDNMMIMMMGTVGEIPKAPELIASANGSTIAPNAEEMNALYPVGMVNLGNTCYFNSCIQMLKEFNELKLDAENVRKIENGPQKLAGCVSDLIKRLRDREYAIKNKGNAVQAINAVLNLSQSFPQFEQFKQQDANECYVALLNTLIRAYKNAGIDISPYFTVETITKAKCIETEGEEELKTDSHNQLTCYINQDVRFIQTGIKAGFSEEMERNSEKLGRNAKWQKHTEISRLPKYLTVNMNRFYFKESSKTNAKILKSVQFPISLDVYDMCTQELKDKLTTRRADIKLEEDSKLERELRKKMLDKEQAEKIFDDGVALSGEFENDFGSNNSGFYELRGIITHKGRSSNDGHYVAWIRSTDDGKWRLFDDDHVTIVDEEAILKTAGGGDWHSAYVMVYESRVIKKYPQLPPAPTSAEVAASEPMEISSSNH
ncbi:unnamed protein product [Caenorhabditis angaria]|uniref:Ubiquitin carboxyl-terminal hydrolase n=1 Tax=Caenorhabditis angaria TaxID=860376 RepID=A0A9P1IA02_9PELO|nr:unnamed protein product [Caenorhabditis angaria]